MDELAMYAIISSLNYAVYTTGPTPFSTPLAKALVRGVLLLSTGAVGYLNYSNQSNYDSRFDIHTTLFVILLTTFWPRTLFLINYSSSTREGGRTAEEKATHRRRMRTFQLAALSFLLGFGIWLVDGLCCYTLRSIRSTIHSYLGVAGYPLEWMLEFHGVWHVLTAIGAGMFVRLVGEMREEHETTSGQKRTGRSAKVDTGENINGSVMGRKRTPTLPGLDAVGGGLE